MERLQVNEIFLSVQGESSHAGWPCVFVRLAGCPLCCAYCDTAYAREEPGRDMTLDQVLDQALSYEVRRVELTGGEPLAQPAAPALLQRLCDAGMTVLLETSGAVDISPVDRRVHVIMDIKCPGSGMTDRMRWENLDLLKETDEVKLVLGSREDYEFARDLVRRRELHRRCVVLLSPVTGQLAPARLVEWMLADGLEARLQLQLHKIIWPDDERGV